jgi:sulfur relay (sulfurtransferase) DsrF/TusC family protein
MRTWFVLTATCCLLLGCSRPEPEKRLTTISPGSVYAIAKTSLAERGLKEETDLWDIEYPESQKAYTYFLKKDVALILFVEKASGKVIKLSKYEKVDQPKSARNWIDLNSFDIEKELSNKPDAGDGL